MNISMSQQFTFTTNKSNYILGFIKKMMVGKAGEIIVSYKGLLKSHLEIYIHFLVIPVQEGRVQKTEVDLGDAVYWNQTGGAAHV